MPYPGGHDVTAGDDLLAGQVACYPRRAGEYDMTAYGVSCVGDPSHGQGVDLGWLG